LRGLPPGGHENFTPTSPAQEYGGPETQLNLGFPHTEEVHGEIIKPQAKSLEEQMRNFFPEESWRERRNNEARPATEEENAQLQPLAKSKTKLDRLTAKLAGAIEQLEKRLGMEPKATRRIRPELDRVRQAFVKKYGAVVTKETPSYLEATMAPGHQFPKEHTFADENVLSQMNETKKLVEDVKKAEGEYKAEKKKLEGKLSENDMIQVMTPDEEGKERAVNIQNRKQAAPGSIKFPTEELQRQYTELIKMLEEMSGPYYKRTAETFRAAINKELKNGHQTLEYLKKQGALDWFNDISKANQAKLILAIGLTASAYLNQEKAEAGEEVPPTLVQKVLTGLAKIRWKESEGFRPVSRVTGSQLTSDIIRSGFDKDSRVFARKRDAYLAALRRSLSGLADLTEEQEEATRKMKPDEIMKTPVLKGWTSMQRQKLALVTRQNTDYLKLLTAEIERLKKLGAKNKGLESIAGKNRYARALKIDKEDMTNSKVSEGGFFNEAVAKISGNLVGGISWGNYRMSTLHIAEAAVAFGSRHPKASVQALHGLATNSVYRDFAIANSPPGFFQRVLEGQDKWGWQKKIDSMINGHIDKAIKSLPGGQVLYDTLSAQLPERAKLGLGATITAVHNAETYPGGPTQYMKDWLANAKNNTPIPPQRQPMFAKVEIENFIEENKAIMFMPNGPIQERTMFQRHGALLKTLTPFLRAIVQQTRFFSGLIDDGIEAAATGNKEKLADSIKAILLGHVMIGGIAGSHVLPNYVWSLLESIDKDDTEKLRSAIDDGQRVMSGGYQIQDFTVKWFPYMNIHGMLLQEIVEGELKNFNPKDKRAVINFVVNGLTIGIIGRIGPEGTMNLAYMWERLRQGMAGFEDYKKYDQNVLMQKVMGRPFATKLAEKKLPFDVLQAWLHSIAKGENVAEQKVNKQAEQKGQKQFNKDIAKIGKNWQKALK
jgi:hypothetical protein